MTVTIDKFGRVLIPKALRDELGFTPGAELALDLRSVGDGAPSLELRAVQGADGALVRDGSLLVHDGRVSGTLDVAQLLAEQRAARASRHAGDTP